jgi:hypothetical protein
VNLSKVGEEDEVTCVGSLEPHQLISGQEQLILKQHMLNLSSNKRSTKNFESKEPMRGNNMLLDGCTNMVINSLLFQFWFQLKKKPSEASLASLECLSPSPHRPQHTHPTPMEARGYGMGSSRQRLVPSPWCVQGAHRGCLEMSG